MLKQFPATRKLTIERGGRRPAAVRRLAVPSREPESGQ
jgi:hypothetical protein